MLDEIRGIFFTFFIIKPEKHWLFIVVSIVLWVSVVSASYRITFAILASPTPHITLLNPIGTQETSEEKTIVTGSVIPQESKLTINGKRVEVNNAGYFSQPLELKLGSNSVEIEAIYLWKKSKYATKIARISSPDTNSDNSKLAYAVKNPSVLGKKKLSPEELEKLNKSMLLEVQEVRIDDQVVLKGRMQNKADGTIGWIKLTANFYNEEDIIDTQATYVTSIDQYLAPSAYANFEIPPTKSQYTAYDIQMEYDIMN